MNTLKHEKSAEDIFYPPSRGLMCLWFPEGAKLGEGKSLVKQNGSEIEHSEGCCLLLLEFHNFASPTFTMHIS